MKTLDQIQLKQNDRDAIREAVNLLLVNFPVEQVILYGSKATGTDDEESDIDLLVLTTRELNWQEKNTITDELFDIELEKNVVISTLILPSREWSEGIYTVLPIHEEVRRYGVAA